MVCFPFGCAPGTRGHKKTAVPSGAAVVRRAVESFCSGLSTRTSLGFPSKPPWDFSDPRIGTLQIFRPQEFLMLVREYHAIWGMQQPRVS
jgi:hypothetical protein